MNDPLVAKRVALQKWIPALSQGMMFYGDSMGGLGGGPMDAYLSQFPNDVPILEGATDASYQGSWGQNPVVSDNIQACCLLVGNNPNSWANRLTALRPAIQDWTLSADQQAEAAAIYKAGGIKLTQWV